MKKTVIFFVLVVVVAFGVITGCKKNSPTAPAATTVPTAIPTPTIDSSALVSVPGGTFTQTDGTNMFRHTISAFKMGKYQVTYKLWYTVYQWAIFKGYTFQDAGIEGNAGTAAGAPPTTLTQPVTTVNWRDAIVWCNAYSMKSGLTPVYYTNSGFTTIIKSSAEGSYGGTTAGSFDNPYVNWSANGYRLPTEGEYQYAASYVDGTNWMPYDHASGATDATTDATATRFVAWYYTNCTSTQNVGSKTANALGIYDMSGNVWEWCFDWYGVYPTTASTNYTGPASKSDYGRVIRGGCYYNFEDYLQVGNRNEGYPYVASSSYGFRFARTN